MWISDQKMNLHQISFPEPDWTVCEFRHEIWLSTHQDLSMTDWIIIPLLVFPYPNIGG
jgi:hypothetical protein